MQGEAAIRLEGEMPGGSADEGAMAERLARSVLDRFLGSDAGRFRVFSGGTGTAQRKEFSVVDYDRSLVLYNSVSH